MVHVDNFSNPAVACRERVTSTNVLVRQSSRSTLFVRTTMSSSRKFKALRNSGTGSATSSPLTTFVVKRTLQERVLDVLLFNGELIVSGCHEKQTSSTT